MGDEREKLFQICRNFIEKNKISCEETIYQCDWVSLSSLEFIEEICEAIGYYRYPEDDADGDSVPLDPSARTKA